MKNSLKYLKELNHHPTIRHNKFKFQKQYKNILKLAPRPRTDMLTSGKFIFFSD